MVLSHTQETVKITTRAIAIKCNSPHYALLRELFSLLFTKPATAIAHIQFSLSGIITLIGPEAYRNLLRDNNKYFDTLVTIPVVGITNDHLDLTIPIADPTDPNRRMTIREILLDNEWCHNIETTKTDGRLLLLTNKLNVKEG